MERLAQRLGVGSMAADAIIRSVISQASPSKVARTARVQRAKRLLDETSLPMTEIANARGLRQPATVQLRPFAEVYGRPPTKIRRTRGSAVKCRSKRSMDVTKKKALFSPRARSGSAPEERSQVGAPPALSLDR